MAVIYLFGAERNINNINYFDEETLQGYEKIWSELTEEEKGIVEHEKTGDSLLFIKDRLYGQWTLGWVITHEGELYQYGVLPVPYTLNINAKTFKEEHFNSGLFEPTLEPNEKYNGDTSPRTDAETDIRGFWFVYVDGVKKYVDAFGNIIKENSNVDEPIVDQPPVVDNGGDEPVVDQPKFYLNDREITGNGLSVSDMDLLAAKYGVDTVRYKELEGGARLYRILTIIAETNQAKVDVLLHRLDTTVEELTFEITTPKFDLLTLEERIDEWLAAVQ